MTDTYGFKSLIATAPIKNQEDLIRIFQKVESGELNGVLLKIFSPDCDVCQKDVAQFNLLSVILPVFTNSVAVWMYDATLQEFPKDNNMFNSPGQQQQQQLPYHLERLQIRMNSMFIPACFAFNSFGKIAVLKMKSDVKDMFRDFKTACASASTFYETKSKPLFLEKI
jgi:hypothetical protein